MPWESRTQYFSHNKWLANVIKREKSDNWCQWCLTVVTHLEKNCGFWMEVFILFVMLIWFLESIKKHFGKAISAVLISTSFFVTHNQSLWLLCITANSLLLLQIEVTLYSDFIKSAWFKNRYCGNERNEICRQKWNFSCDHFPVDGCS